MPQLEMKLPVEPEAIAKAIAGLTYEEVAVFARELVEQCWHIDEDMAAAFCDGVADERAEQTAEPVPA